MNKKIKKAFTLLEIVLVIVIIWVIMWATMKFGWDRIGFLNNKNVKEQFVSSYDSLYSSNMMTSYYQGEIYNELKVKSEKWKDMIEYFYNTHGEVYSGRTFVDGGSYEINGLSLNWKDIDLLNIVMKPHVLGCKINGKTDTKASISILVNNSKNYCFQINSDTCRISSVSCK